MRSSIKYYTEIIISHFWIIPTVIASLHVILYFYIGYGSSEEVSDFISSFIPYASSLEGAKYVLSSVATGILSVAGVLFSVTFVVLQQAANMYSPRVIENFIRSTFIQSVLGFYIGTFSFSLLQLNTINYKEKIDNEMNLGMTTALILAFICVELIIFYIHHVAKSIRSISILQQISLEAESTIETIEGIFSSKVKKQEEKQAPALQVKSYIQAQKRGYLQRIEFNDLKKKMDKLTIEKCELLVKPGDYIQLGTELAVLTNIKDGDNVKKKLSKFFIIGADRTRSQDISFSVRQMVDIALRALSPGINDPYTAVEAINSIGSALLRFTKTDLGKGVLYYNEHFSIQVLGPTYQEFLILCFDEILRAGKDFAVVLKSVIRVLETCIHQTEDDDFRKLQQEMYHRAHGQLLELKNGPWAKVVG